MKYVVAVLAALGCAASVSVSRPEVVEGNPASRVRVLIYDDLQCSDCLRLRTLLDEKILPRYGSRVAFVHRDLPLPRHDWARPAAVASRWVYERDHQLGIVFRREIMAEQSHLTPATLRPWLREFARRNQLDPDGIVESLADPRLVGLVEQDYLAAVARGVSKTPSVYVGGQAFVEIIIYDELARALDVELGK
ncbi:MAG: thioredoxin domain-containing protein [Acidobacteriota bacterium]